MNSTKLVPVPEAVITTVITATKGNSSFLHKKASTIVDAISTKDRDFIDKRWDLGVTSCNWDGTHSTRKYEQTVNQLVYSLEFKWTSKSSDKGSESLLQSREIYITLSSL